MSQAAIEAAPHPSPHRGRASLAGLLYGLIAAPGAWAASQIANAALGQAACFPGTEPLATPALGGVHSLQAAILIASLLISGSAAALALVNWRATRGETAGDQHALLAIGEGRSRFMAFAGLLTSIGFIVASLFSIPALMFVPAC